jgi:hypothetical protein
MPIVLGLLAVGAVVGAVAALGGRAAGAKTVAFLDDGPPMNVVWDGMRWRPMGAADTAGVLAWAASGKRKAKINGRDHEWTGMGFVA